MRMHESHSERALSSQVLRIRLSRQITIQNALFRFSKPCFERVLHSQRVKSGFQIRKGSESWSVMAFGTWFAPLWTGPICECCRAYHFSQMAWPHRQASYPQSMWSGGRWRRAHPGRSVSTPQTCHEGCDRWWWTGWLPRETQRGRPL